MWKTEGFVMLGMDQVVYVEYVLPLPLVSEELIFSMVLEHSHEPSLTYNVWMWFLLHGTEEFIQAQKYMAF